jgi:hypothetical protein
VASTGQLVGLMLLLLLRGVFRLCNVKLQLAYLGLAQIVQVCQENVETAADVRDRGDYATVTGEACCRALLVVDIRSTSHSYMSSGHFVSTSLFLVFWHAAVKPPTCTLIRHS